MGRGRGYYDTYLTRYKEKQGELPHTVALAFKQQIVPDLPTDQSDVLISKILAPKWTRRSVSFQHFLFLFLKDFCR